MLEVTQVFIGARFKTAQSKSDSGFTIELPKTINIPDDTIAYITEVVLPVSWTTIDERNISLYYSILCHNDTDGKYDTSFCIWPTDYKHYNETILAEGMMDK
jgi:hypothetical protein